MGDVHYIVDKLNAPPFSLGVTLISFRQASTAEHVAQRYVMQATAGAEPRIRAVRRLRQSCCNCSVMSSSGSAPKPRYMVYCKLPVMAQTLIIDLPSRSALHAVPSHPICIRSSFERGYCSHLKEHWHCCVSCSGILAKSRQTRRLIGWPTS